MQAVPYALVSQINILNQVGQLLMTTNILIVRWLEHGLWLMGSEANPSDPQHRTLKYFSFLSRKHTAILSMRGIWNGSPPHASQVMFYQTGLVPAVHLLGWRENKSASSHKLLGNEAATLSVSKSCSLRLGSKVSRYCRRCFLHRWQMKGPRGMVLNSKLASVLTIRRWVQYKPSSASWSISFNQRTKFLYLSTPFPLHSSRSRPVRLWSASTDLLPLAALFKLDSVSSSIIARLCSRASHCSSMLLLADKSLEYPGSQQ